MVEVRSQKNIAANDLWENVTTYGILLYILNRTLTTFKKIEKKKKNCIILKGKANILILK